MACKKSSEVNNQKCYIDKFGLVGMFYYNGCVATYTSSVTS